MKFLLIGFCILSLVKVDSAFSRKSCNSKNYKRYIFNPKKMKKLIEKEYDRCKISNIDFDEEDLRKAFFYKSELKNVTFTNETNIEGVNFERVKLKGVTFDNVTAKKANFKHGKSNSETTISIIGSNFEGADFSHFAIHNTSSIKISNSNFRKAIFVDVNLIDAHLEDVDFTEAVFSPDFFMGGVISLKRSKFDNANLEGGRWFSAGDSVELPFEETSFIKANLKGSTLVGFNLNGADFTEANMVGSILFGLELEGANFIEANLTGASFYNDTNFAGAVLTGAALAGIKYKIEHFTEEEIERYNITTGAINLDQAICEWGDCVELVEQAKMEKEIAEQIKLEEEQRKVEQEQEREQAQLESDIFKSYITTNPNICAFQQQGSYFGPGYDLYYCMLPQATEENQEYIDYVVESCSPEQNARVPIYHCNLPKGQQDMTSSAPPQTPSQITPQSGVASTSQNVEPDRRSQEQNVPDRTSSNRASDPDLEEQLRQIRSMQGRTKKH